MNTEEYLTRYHGWEGKAQGNAIIGCCPMHPERRPSFAIYPDDDHWYCFTERRSGDFPGMVNILEFGDTNTDPTWVTVFNRIEQLEGGYVKGKREVSPCITLRMGLPYANAQQRVLLTAAMHWWYTQLWMHDPHHRGQAYFLQRGVSLPDLRFCLQLGYAPPSWSADEDRRLYTSFAQCMQRAIGTGWEPLATSLGLLSKSTGNLRLRDRVLFCSTNDEGECVFFQSRQVQFGRQRPMYPYLTSTGIRKVPFSIAIPQMTTTMTHVESPFGVATLAPYGLSAIAWHGGPSRTTLQEPWLQSLLGDRIQVIVMDNDVPHHTCTGEVYYPGDRHAQVLTTFFESHHYRWIRVIPPVAVKGLDEWKQVEGIDPYRHAVQHALATSSQTCYDA